MNNPHALARAAEAMLRALGGTEIKLRCPVGTAKDELARQLGLEAPVAEDIAVSPVVVHPSGQDLELLIAPSSVAPYMQDRGQTAEQFFNGVLAVLHAGCQYQLKLFHVEQCAGAAYLYRITVTANS